MIHPLLRFAFEVGSELWHEWRRKRAAARRAKEWAETPATIRGCPHCHEINYTPGAVTCRACGRLL